MRRYPAAVAAAALILGLGLQAHGAPCSSLPKPLYGMGGSAQKPLIGALAVELAKLSDPITVIYDSSKGACSGIYGLYGPTPTKMEGTAAYWLPTGVESTCDLPIAGQDADYGSLGNSATLCNGIPSLPAEIGDFRGPVTAINLFVPNASSQTSISSAGIYFAYGFGAAGQAAPWTDETALIRRNANAFVQIFVSIASGVPVEKFKGVDALTNQGSINLVANHPEPEKAIGFASSQVVDANRNVVRTLAYQHTDQTCGYWPDSTPDAFDKANVRSGQYFLWSRLHFLAKVDGAGKITNPLLADVIDYYTEAKSPPNEIDYTKIIVDNGGIPVCAMKVSREGDLGAIASFAPPEPCNCYFDFVATGATSCTACTTDAQCTTAGSKCRRGYCEEY